MHHILLVDDEPSIRKALSIGLSNKSITVDAAENGQTGIQMAHSKVYDILIADLCLPDINGLEVIREIKRKTPDIISIMITGNGTLQSSIDAIRMEVSVYIEKPLTLNIVKAAIGEAISKREEKEIRLREKVEAMTNTYQRSVATSAPALSADQETGKREIAESLPRLAHQINNPLCAINVSAQMALTALSDETAIKKYLSAIIRATEKISDINREIMNLGKAAAGKMELLTLQEIIRDTLALFSNLFQLKGIDVEFMEIQAPVMIRGNRFKIEQVLSNLILNAVDAVENSMVKKLSILLSTDQDRIRVQVCDTGCGIPRDSREKIFLPYYTTKKEGTGLGLPVVKQMVEELCGTITLENSGDGVTGFGLSFPVAMTAEA